MTVNNDASKMFDDIISGKTREINNAIVALVPPDTLLDPVGEWRKHTHGEIPIGGLLVLFALLLEVPRPVLQALNPRLEILVAALVRCVKPPAKD